MLSVEVCTCAYIMYISLAIESGPTCGIACPVLVTLTKPTPARFSQHEMWHRELSGSGIIAFLAHILILERFKLFLPSWQHCYSLVCLKSERAILVLVPCIEPPCSRRGADEGRERKAAISSGKEDANTLLAKDI